MQWINFVVAAFSVYPTDSWWIYSWNLSLLKHILGASLIALNLWSVASQFETIGEFGWFFGDFFINDEAIPLKLSYGDKLFGCFFSFDLLFF
jgi:phosphatidylethanolamine N-methyltransferase